MLFRSLERLQPRARVLFVSGYPRDAIEKMGVVEDGDEFLAKPFTPASLLERVRSVLGPSA